MPLPPGRFDYSPIIDRPPIKWPDDARVALYVGPALEHHEYVPDYEGFLDPWPRTPYPDVQQYSFRDYGNRVGAWRMFDVLDKYRIRCTAIMSLAVLEHYPEIVSAVLERNWEIMSHGFYNTRYLYGYSEEREREFYRASIDAVQKHTGKTLKGMLGPAITGTERTPDLMAEAGLVYHADWMHDDQPTPIKVASGRLVSIPYTVELNDAVVLRNHPHEGEYFAAICRAQFDQLYTEGAQSGRVMCIVLHPYLVGQPHRIKYLDDILRYVTSHSGVWQTTAAEIADYYIAHYYEAAVAHAQQLNAANT
jgi:allantoinase